MNGRSAWLLAAVLGVAPAAADRLHLESGGVIETDRWWIEGENVLYRSAGGTIGIPRSMVVRVEPGAGAAPAAAAERPRAPRATLPDAGEAQRVRQQIEEGVAAFDAGDCETASNLFFGALAYAPEAYPVRVRYALCEIRLGHDESARNAVLDGLVLRPDGAELHELLGDLRDRDENLADALLAWRRALELAPSERLEQKIAKAQRDLDSRRGYEFARTSHFNLRYDGSVDEALAAEVSDHLEQAFWDLTNVYGHTPQQPITTLLYPNQAFREVTRSAEWVGGVYDGKIRVPLGGLKHLHRGARRVLTHELAHAVIHSKSRQRCPRWLQEGLAQIGDGTKLAPADEAQVRERLARLTEPWTWADDSSSYPMALSLVRWLERRRDFSYLAWVLELLGEGQDVDQALERAYGDDYAGLVARWSAETLAGGAR